MPIIVRVTSKDVSEFCAAIYRRAIFYCLERHYTAAERYAGQYVPKSKPLISYTKFHWADSMREPRLLFLIFLDIIDARTSR